MERIGDLRRRLTVCSAVRHRQGVGNTVRREEQVAFLPSQPAVEIDGKGIVAVNDMGDPTYATPAIDEGTIYVRTHKRLYAFGLEN